VGHSIGTQDWPPQGLYEALAIAQHYGVPTRLLDFSSDPLIAAYFAVENPQSDAEDIAVWAVDLQQISLAAKDHLYSQIAHSDDVDQSIRFDADQIEARRRKALSV
jgi:hypothetical protein